MSLFLASLSSLSIHLQADAHGPRAVSPASTATPIWWNRDALPEINSPADCAPQALSWRLAGSEAGTHEKIVMTMPDDSTRSCATLAEWRAAHDLGGYAMSKIEMSKEIQFLERDLAYSVIPHLEPARHSGFAGMPWDKLAQKLVQEDDGCQKGKRVEENSVKWEFEPNVVWYSNETTFERVKLLARGDYDGDGWEDLIAMSSGGYTQGSGRFYSVRMFSCRESGRVINTSSRLVLGLPSKAQSALHRSRLASSCGLPEDTEILLKGSLQTNERPLDIEMRIRLKDGFVTGSYEYAHIGKPIPVEGTLGTDAQLALAEFALGEQPNGVFSLSWSVDARKLELSGLWHESLEGQRVRLEGSLPSPAEGGGAPKTSSLSGRHPISGAGD